MDRNDFFYSKKTPWSYTKVWPILDKIGSTSNGAQDRNEAYKAKCIDPFVAKLESELIGYDIHLRKLILKSVMKPGYYLLPTTFKLKYLTQLKLYCCYVDFNDFYKAMNVLNRLKVVELDLVAFINPSEENSSSNIIKFPESLTDLYWKENYISNISLENKSYNFIFSEKFTIRKSIYEPFPQSLPKLERIHISNNPEKLQYINDWIFMNPGLSKISYNVNELNEVDFNLLTNNHGLRELEVEFSSQDHTVNELNLPTLSSVDTLIIRNITTNHFDALKNLTLICPKISKLELDLFNYNESFLTELESQLLNLKHLTLRINSRTELEFNIPSFSNINKLSLHFSNNLIENFLLPLKKNLGIISVSMHKRSITLENYIKNFTHSNWIMTVKGKK
ncbi:hypothetical protein CONCODRAFT_19611 [Conidiobolus coronatus NRRL 28638]|uniref:L domain-like protein n=1 Tax=Conidiobolus coronatus (strain ATCC 28846 / CBS 209.66 / NRRL 28638) TaxID=796925 RepID=A0A137NX82_CONC2|nr:hypothetical protein CONCODRAFT_19611 [Conidiobolus coronatus NRRL 28638]|eukprot:KXN67450.1 hypothetical protein CONCODRAFT_19611 [Conidiobolus coronatus NRRL 28638]